MKIGIFGDSFAASEPPSELDINNTESWVDIVQKKHQVTNYAKVGSCLFFSVDNYKKFNHLYDKNIFIVTNPGRIKLRDDIPIHYKDPNKKFIVPGGYVEVMLKEAIKTGESPTLIAALNAAKSYYEYIHDDNFDLYVHSLMLEDIKKINPNLLLIYSSAWKQLNPQIFVMADIFHKENKHWGLDFASNPYIYNLLRDHRKCHMTYENNVIFGNKILNYLETNIEPIFSIEEFVTPDNKEFYIKYE